MPRYEYMNESAPLILCEHQGVRTVPFDVKSVCPHVCVNASGSVCLCQLYKHSVRPLPWEQSVSLAGIAGHHG